MSASFELLLLQLLLLLLLLLHSPRSGGVQVLRVQRNQIQRNWDELNYVSKTLRDLDASNNRFNWAQAAAFAMAAADARALLPHQLVRGGTLPDAASASRCS